jgi:hypothetical protein
MKHTLVLCALLAGCGLSNAGLTTDSQTSRTSSLRTLDAVFVDAQFPASLRCGENATVSVTMRNTSTVTWTQADGFKLGAVDDEDPLYKNDVRIFLQDEQVPPGADTTFTFDIVAPEGSGPRVTDWQMVQERVQWFGASAKRTVQIDCGSTPPPDPTPTGGDVELCHGVFADSSGQVAATRALQTCVDQTREGGTLDLPAGTYLMDGQLRLLQPITLRTAGAAGNAGSCMHGLSCATLKAAPNLSVENGFVMIAGERVVLEHLVLDGNRSARLGSSAASTCAGGHNRVGFNATAQTCVDCSFLASASINALCGSGFEWVGDGASILGSTFRDNGDNSRHMMWSDGLTLIRSDGAVVRNNEFIDNSDIGFIAGGARGGVFIDNVVQQARQLAFGGLMLDNFNGSSHGDFSGAVLSGNRVDCTQRLCDYGIVVGPHAWYPSANIRGGEVSGNTVLNAKMGMVVSGGGTPDAPVSIFGNAISGSPGSATFLCGNRSSANYVISPDSVVDTRGDPAPFSRFPVTDCP